VRITVQLIKADDGTHIWADDYDRQLTDIFAIQEDIARAITASLRMPLGLKPGENLVNNRTIDAESYQQYLRAKALRCIARVGPKTSARRSHCWTKSSPAIRHTRLVGRCWRLCWTSSRTMPPFSWPGWDRSRMPSVQCNQRKP